MKLLPLLKILMMPLQSESLDILKYFFENFNDNAYITDYLKRFSPQEEETNALQDSTEEEIAETESPLDEKEEESDEQKEEEWSSYPSLPTNESNSLTLTLYDALHAYQRRMNDILIPMILWILLKYPFLMKLMLVAMMP